MGFIFINATKLTQFNFLRLLQLGNNFIGYWITAVVAKFLDVVRKMAVKAGMRN